MGYYSCHIRIRTPRNVVLFVYAQRNEALLWWQIQWVMRSPMGIELALGDRIQYTCVPSLHSDGASDPARHCCKSKMLYIQLMAYVVGLIFQYVFTDWLMKCIISTNCYFKNYNKKLWNQALMACDSYQTQNFAMAYYKRDKCHVWLQICKDLVPSRVNISKVMIGPNFVLLSLLVVTVKIDRGHNNAAKPMTVHISSRWIIFHCIQIIGWLSARL